MLALGVAIGVLGASSAAGVQYDPGADDDRGAYSINGIRSGVREARSPTRVAAEAPREFYRGPACTGGSLDLGSDTCSPLGSGFVGCPAGVTPTEPLWVRYALADGSWGPWELVTWYSCPSQQDLIAAIEREWTELRPQPTAISLQPDTGRVYATVPTIAIADPTARLHSAQVLGASVTIRATPAHYTWSWGDGESTTTDDPGAPYPHATVTHAYGRALDAATVSLTTTWSGEYRIGGGPWTDFDTTIATTTAGPTLEVLHPRSRLVAEPG